MPPPLAYTSSHPSTALLDAATRQAIAVFSSSCVAAANPGPAAPTPLAGHPARRRHLAGHPARRRHHRANAHMRLSSPSEPTYAIVAERTYTRSPISHAAHGRAIRASDWGRRRCASSPRPRARLPDSPTLRCSTSRTKSPTAMPPHPVPT